MAFFDAGSCTDKGMHWRGEKYLDFIHASMLSPDALAEKPDPVQQFDQNSQKIYLEGQNVDQLGSSIISMNSLLWICLKKCLDMAKFYTNSLGS